MIPPLLQGSWFSPQLEYLWANGTCHIHITRSKCITLCGKPYMFGVIYTFPGEDSDWLVNPSHLSVSGDKVCEQCRKIARGICD